MTYIARYRPVSRTPSHEVVSRIAAKHLEENPAGVFKRMVTNSISPDEALTLAYTVGVNTGVFDSRGTNFTPQTPEASIRLANLQQLLEAYCKHTGEEPRLVYSSNGAYFDKVA